MKILKEYAAIVNERLNELMPEMPDGEFENGGRPWLVNNAMRYSLVAGGKRLRPAMLMAAVDMLGGDMDIALDFGYTTHESFARAFKKQYAVSPQKLNINTAL